MHISTYLALSLVALVATVAQSINAVSVHGHTLRRSSPHNRAWRSNIPEEKVDPRDHLQIDTAQQETGNGSGATSSQGIMKRRRKRGLKKKASAFQASHHVMELHRLSTKSDISLHPHMEFQQHANRAIRRLATMTGRSVSDDELTHNLRRRWELLDLPPEQLKIKKRFNHGFENLLRGESHPDTGRSNANDNGHGNNGAMVPVKGPGAGNLNAAAASAAAAAAKASGVIVNVMGASMGFSQAALAALTSNSETVGPNDKANVLGLDIEGDDNSYFTGLTIGTPGAPFKILMDSGSADFWVPGENCASCTNHQTLGTVSSSSFVATNKQFQVTYGSGAVMGEIIQDNVILGNLTLTGHTFGATSQESPQFGDSSNLFDGLMGTALSTLSEQKVLTPIESLAQQGLVAAATMGYALGRVADGSNQGTVTLGGINSAQVGGTIAELPNVSQSGFWEANLDDVTVGGASLGLQGRTAIFDTGTTLILIPPTDAAAIHAQIPGAANAGNGMFTLPCTSTTPVAFTFGGQSFTLNSNDLLYQPASSNLQGTCISSIVGQSTGSGAQTNTQYLLGDTFLKNAYFATNVESNVIGLAPLA